MENNEITLSCGHSFVFPANSFGRGNARQERIKLLKTFSCKSCSTTHFYAFSETLTAIAGINTTTGKFINRPYNEQERQNYVAKRVNSLPSIIKNHTN